MKKRRIVYQNWIVDLGHDPDRPPDPLAMPSTISLDAPGARNIPGDDLPARNAQERRTDELRAQVRSALANLDPEEREFVHRFYFMGESYRSLSERTGRAVHKLESMNSRCLRKLRKRLMPFVREVFGLGIEANECPICCSPHRKAIDDVLARRDRSETYRAILKKIREEYGLPRVTPQLLIGHEKYHPKP